MLEFLKVLIGFFDRHNIPYMLSESVAMGVYTLARATRDFDFVIHLNKSHVTKLTDQFQSGYYYDEEVAIDAIRKKGMFNIIDHASGF